MAVASLKKDQSLVVLVVDNYTLRKDRSFVVVVVDNYMGSNGKHLRGTMQ